MEPPNLRTVPYTHGHSCESCRSFSVKDKLYYCGRFDVNVGSGNICDDYEFAGSPYKPVPQSLTTERPQPLGGPRISPR
jgi:hypothetical protein